MKLGVMTPMTDQPEAAMGRVKELGLPSCQISVAQDLATPELAKRLRSAADAAGIEITTVWAGSPGPHVWNFLEGPTTIGIVPPAWRAQRVEAIKKGANFAALAGVPSVSTHAGFIPENPTDPEYPGVLDALRDIATHAGERGVEFWFETGQETPVTLLRVFQDLGLGNLGINFDPANLLMYGKANPIDALDIIGKYVRGVHAKDGEYPTNGRELGVEKPIGEGRVNFPAFLARLRDLGFDGALTIEREISGPQQIADIKRAIEYLNNLISLETAELDTTS